VTKNSGHVIVITLSVLLSTVLAFLSETGRVDAI